MGVMSRRVLPVCGNLCYCCPAMRPRSRQPVKRYKKLIADIFELQADGEPNERKINKLCEYVSRNLARIPQITSYLEQRCYKELRNENHDFGKVVACIYRKLLSTCAEHMPFFSASTLNIVKVFLDQGADDLQIIGCLLLDDFLKNQVDSSCMFSLEGLTGKLCLICQGSQANDKGVRIRSAALQAISSMVQFMADYSNVSLDFDDIILVVLESYRPTQTILASSAITKSFADLNAATDSTLDMSRSPAYWSSLCLHNMTKIAKVATTARRVLDPLFRYFDTRNCWSIESGIAFSVLHEMLVLMEDSEQSSHLLLYVMVKHLDQKNITERPKMQIDVLKVVSRLSIHTTNGGSISLCNAISELMRHVRKCMRWAIQASDDQTNPNKLNPTFYSALEECIYQLMDKVESIEPILDMFTIMLEKLSPAVISARATTATLYRMVQILASTSNLSEHGKAFPEPLFQQILLAMMHVDSMARVGSHRVLSAILMPCTVCPWSAVRFPVLIKFSTTHEICMLALSAFSSSQSTVKTETFLGLENSQQLQARMQHHHRSVCQVLNLTDDNMMSMRLNSNQASLLLGSIWIQASMRDSNPSNFEAMGHSFQLVLLCLTMTDVNHAMLIRCLQLAFSLRKIALENENLLQAYHKRSLYILSSLMLISSAKVINLPSLLSLANASLTEEEKVDSHISMVENGQLGAILTASSNSIIAYGSEEDEIAASTFLVSVSKDDMKLREAAISDLKAKVASSPEVIGVEEQLHREFSADDCDTLGTPVFRETPQSSPCKEKNCCHINEDAVPLLLEDENALFEESGDQSDVKISGSHDLLSVNKLIDTVLETARQVTISPILTKPISYNQMKQQCEALIIGKQQKVSFLYNFSMKEGFEGQDNVETTVGTNHVKQSTHEDAMLNDVHHLCCCESTSSESELSLLLPPHLSLLLPPVSPYDKFLKAAGTRR